MSPPTAGAVSGSRFESQAANSTAPPFETVIFTVAESVARVVGGGFGLYPGEFGLYPA